MSDFQIYKKFAIKAHLNKDKIAREYINNLNEDDIDEKFLRKLYNAHITIQSKIMLIKLGKGIFKQGMVVTKDKFSSKLKILSFINPENISTDLSDEEFIALINSVDDVKDSKQNVYLVIAKNMLCELLNINIHTINEQIEETLLNSDKMDKVLNIIVKDKKPIIEDVVENNEEEIYEEEEVEIQPDNNVIYTEPSQSFAESIQKPPTPPPPPSPIPSLESEPTTPIPKDDYIKLEPLNNGVFDAIESVYSSDEESVASSTSKKRKLSLDEGEEEFTVENKKQNTEIVNDAILDILKSVEENKLNPQQSTSKFTDDDLQFPFD